MMRVMFRVSQWLRVAPLAGSVDRNGAIRTVELDGERRSPRGERG